MARFLFGAKLNIQATFTRIGLLEWSTHQQSHIYPGLWHHPTSPVWKQVREGQQILGGKGSLSPTSAPASVTPRAPFPRRTPPESDGDFCWGPGVPAQQVRGLCGVLFSN